MPYTAPGCYLMNHVGTIESNVTTKFYDAQSYAFDYNLLEMKINDGYIPAHTNEPATYVGGDATIELNEAMNEVVRGYFDSSVIAKAAP